MKNTLLAMSAVAALCAAAPAAAQKADQYGSRYGNQYGVDTNFDARIGQLQTRLDAGVRNGTIDRREAWPLRRQLSELARLEDRYGVNGLTDWERDDLRQRIRALRTEIRTADNGGYDRYERTGQWSEYDRYEGRGGPYEEVVCERRSGVGGLLDSLTGRQNCYSIGDRVGSGLYGVPTDYRDRYRDGRGVYYRSDGRNVYEIDARTNTVVQVHRLPRN